MTYLIVRATYNWIACPLLKLGMFLLSGFSIKIREGYRIRRKQNGAWPWLTWKAKQSPIWIHCASYEFEYAKPFITELKARQRPQMLR